MNKNEFISELSTYWENLGAEEWRELHPFSAPYEWSGEDSLELFTLNRPYIISSSGKTIERTFTTWKDMSDTLLDISVFATELYIYDKGLDAPVFYVQCR